jgi:hypothetical protein
MNTESFCSADKWSLTDWRRHKKGTKRVWEEPIVARSADPGLRIGRTRQVWHTLVLYSCIAQVRTYVVSPIWMRMRGYQSQSTASVNSLRASIFGAQYHMELRGTFHTADLDHNDVWDASGKVENGGTLPLERFLMTHKCCVPTCVPAVSVTRMTIPVAFEYRRQVSDFGQSGTFAIHVHTGDTVEECLHFQTDCDIKLELFRC